MKARHSDWLVVTGFAAAVIGAASLCHNVAYGQTHWLPRYPAAACTVLTTYSLCQWVECSLDGGVCRLVSQGGGLRVECYDGGCVEFAR